MRRMVRLLLVLWLCPSAALASDEAQQAVTASLAYCGQNPRPPYGNVADEGRRPCAVAGPRRYTPRHQGIAYKALDLETQACLVPDASYQLLDDIIDAVHARVAAEGLTPATLRTGAGVKRVSEITGDILQEKGFLLWIPTDSLGDALHPRATGRRAPRHIYDCDTGSLILLTVAETLGLDAALVDITLNSGNGHNYVRWALADGLVVDWDTNARAPCATPENRPSFEGVAMTEAETMAYILALRGMTWDNQHRYAEALADYIASSGQDPSRPLSFNNAAWIVATREFAGRETFRDYAVGAAERAAGLEGTASRLDTLACAYAYKGDFEKARETQELAVAQAPNDGAIRRRLGYFQAATPRDCTGEV